MAAHAAGHFSDGLPAPSLRDVSGVLAANLTAFLEYDAHALVAIFFPGLQIGMTRVWPDGSYECHLKDDMGWHDRLRMAQVDGVWRFSQPTEAADTSSSSIAD